MAVMVYRTRDGLAEYGFSIDFQPDVGWRAYIVFPPFYQSLDDSLQLPYQSIDRDGRSYVDWSEKINNLEDAKAVAALWAELVQGYQRVLERRARYDELIKRCQRALERRRETPADPDRLGNDAVPAGAAGPGRGPGVPPPTASAESLSDLQKSA